MRKKQMGRTDIMVSELCLGTMTFGTQTPETEAHAQIDLSLERGINFLDTAEMYPVNPVSKETIGRTEEIFLVYPTGIHLQKKTLAVTHLKQLIHPRMYW